jgi:transcriptional regulator with XRE-family HTH domain
MVLGPRVRELRTERGLSQERLARRAGLSWGVVQRIEAGTTVDPHYSTLSGIADALGISLAELVEEGPSEASPKASAPPSESRHLAYQVAFDEIAGRAAEAVEHVAENARQAVEQHARYLAGEVGESEAPGTAEALLAYFLASGRLTADDMEEARDALLRESEEASSDVHTSRDVERQPVTNGE